MIWFVRATVIAVFILDQPIFSPRKSIAMNLLIGLITGLAIIGLSLLLGKLGKKISAKAPVGARRAGVGLYWLGIAIAVFSIGLSVFAAYHGASGPIVWMPISFSIVYWAAGWGLRRALTPN